MLKLINLLSLIKWIIETVVAGYQLFLKKREEKKSEQAEELEKDIEKAESEDDFRDAADRLSKLGRK